jgi:hypothetical protein
MPALCDVNFLLALCYERHIHHLQALEWFNQQEDLGVVLCRNTQLGFLRLLTNPLIMQTDVCALQQAWVVYDTASSDGRFVWMAEPEGVENSLRQYTSSGQVSPKLWQDAYLAAFARAGKLSLVTFDQGFQQFGGLSIVMLG